MEDNKTLEAVADTVLDKPVKLEVDISPVNKIHAWLQKKGWKPKKKTFDLHRINMGTLIRISRILLSVDISIFDKSNLLESNYRAIDQYGDKLAECVALCIHNKKSEVPRSLVLMVLANFTTAELYRVLSIVLKQMDIASFMNSIISIKGANILAKSTASVKNASGMSQIAGEIIAPGVPSAE